MFCQQVMDRQSLSGFRGCACIRCGRLRLCFFLVFLCCCGLAGIMAPYHAGSTACGSAAFGMAASDEMPGDATGHAALDTAARLGMADCRGKQEPADE